MKNAIPLILILSLIIPALMFGKVRDVWLKENEPVATTVGVEDSIPDKGNVEVLNGCGQSGVATMYTNYLRKKRFDVKNMGNTEVENKTIWNYSKTMVISRKKDMTIAEEVAKLLRTEPPVFIRTDHNLTDVTVIIGHENREFKNEQ